MELLTRASNRCQSIPTSRVDRQNELPAARSTTSLSTSGADPVNPVISSTSGRSAGGLLLPFGQAWSIGRSPSIAPSRWFRSPTRTETQASVTSAYYDDNAVNQTLTAAEVAGPAKRSMFVGGSSGKADVHRASLRATTRAVFADSFDIRAEMAPDQVWQALNRRKFTLTDLDAFQVAPSWSSFAETKLSKVTTLLRELRSGRWVAMLLRLLAFFGVFSAPLQLLEVTCELGWERSWVAAAKALHLALSLVYFFLAAGRVLTSEDGPAASFRRFLPRSDDDGEGPMQRQKQAAGRSSESWRPRSSVPWQGALLDLVAVAALLGEVGHVSVERSGGSLLLGFQWFWILNASKCWRLFYRSPDEDASESLGFCFQVLDLVTMLLLFTHICACALAALALLESEGGISSWADPQLSNEPRSCTDFYMVAFYFSAYTVSSVGYGDVTPINRLERLWVSLFMVLSQVYFAKMFADLNFITSTHNFWRAERQQRLAQTSAALDSMGIPQVLRQRVLAYQDFVWEVQKERRAQGLIRDLSSQLREELRVVLYHRLLMSAPFLQQLSTKVLRCLILSLSDCTFLPGDFIVRLGDEGSDMFFIRDGSMGVFVDKEVPGWSDSEICVLRRGDYFGEVALLTGRPRTSWVMARTYSVCCTLPESAIHEVSSFDPYFVITLIRSLQKKLNLVPSRTWQDVAARLSREFADDAQLYDFTCSGIDGEAPEGLVTWTRYQSLMTRLEMPTLDQKLLWVELDLQGEGAVSFETFMACVTPFIKGSEHSTELEAEFPAPPSRRMSTPRSNQGSDTLSPRLSIRRSFRQVEEDPSALELQLSVQKLEYQMASLGGQVQGVAKALSSITSHLGIANLQRPTSVESLQVPWAGSHQAKDAS